MRPLVLSALLLGSAFHAALGQTFGDFTYSNNNGEITITGFSSSPGPTSTSVPSTILGLPVKKIGGWTFSYRTNLTSITIPNSVTTIESGAFYACTGLTSVTIPNSVTTISDWAFQSCTSLSSITIPNSITTIGLGSFNSCTSLTSITIPNSVTTISNYAFSGCASLTSITIPNSVTSFGDDIWTFPFSGCTGLTEINVDSGNASFSSINGVLFNKAVTSIIFYPPGKIGTYTIPSGVSTIKIFTFQGSPGLTSIIIPNSVTTIPEYAFSSCTSLTSIIIPNSVTTIPEYAFSSCTSLTSITIPNSITTIGNSGFQGCTSLTSITIPGSVASIGANAFSDCSNLSSLTIANGVTSIGYTAFAGCPLLTSITIPNSVTSIEDQAFGNSMIGPGPGTNLVSITIPEVFITALDRIGIRGPAATKALVSGIASSLATNNSFITQLSNNDSFVTAVANKILAASNNYGLATRSALNTATSTLATKTELTNALADSRVDGINSVISNPNLWTLYTTNQIKAMVMGDLMLTRTNNGQFVLNYDIEQSDNLTTWSPYQGFAMPLTNLPTDKAFVRIKLKNQQ